MATESTEEHGNINYLIAIFSCASVDSVAMNFFYICTELALDHVHRQPAPGRFLVLGLHIRAGIPHGLDHLVE